MPLKGVVCPVDGQRISSAACLACRAGKTPRAGLDHWCDFTYEQLSAMLDTSGRKTAGLSATMLGGCRRATRLKNEHDYYGQPKRMYPAFRGQMGHLVLEKNPEPLMVYEQRFEMALPWRQKKITGQIDKLDIMRRKICDSKTKEDGKIPDEPDHSHVMQLNVYRLLVRMGWPQIPFSWVGGDGEAWDFPVGVPGELDIETLELNYWSFSHVKTFSSDSGTDPVTIYPDDVVMAYIMEGLEELSAPELPEIPDGYGPDSYNKLCTLWCPVREQCEEEMFVGMNNFNFSKGF